MAYSEQLTFAPGNGVTTNVTERLMGELSIQVNEGTSGGGIVNILNPLNAFVGSATVTCGTLGVTTLETDGRPSDLGRAPGTLTLGNGTFRYFGATPSVSDMGLWIASASANGACVVRCDGDLALNGPVDATQGAFVKDGPGTLTIATKARTSGANMLSRSAGTSYNWILQMKANGDAPVQGYGVVTVREGHLAIDTPDTVTTVLGTDETAGSNSSCVLVGARSGATAAKSEPYGHLDVYGGDVRIGSMVMVGYYPGKETTRPDADSGSSFNVYGGTIRRVSDFASGQNTIGIGWVQNYNDRPGCPSFNIFGGTVDAFYIRVAVNRGSRGKLLVAGGKLTGYGVYGAHDQGGESATDEYIPQSEIHVCSNGVMETTMIQPARNGFCDFTLKVTDGGRLVRRQGIATTPAYAQSPHVFVFDGGVLDLENSPFDVLDKDFQMKLGPQASTVYQPYASYSHVFPCPVTSLGASDGGLVLSNPNGASTVAFTGGMDITGPVVLDGPVLKLGKDARIGALRTLRTDAALVLCWTGSAFAKLTASALDVPGVVRVTLDGDHPAGTYDILSLPADTTVTPEKFLLAADSTTEGATFGMRTAGGRKVVTMTVAARSVTSYGWAQPAGGVWSTGGNWNGGSAPANGPDSRATFSAAAAAAGTAVTLDAPVTLGSLVFSASPGYRLEGETLTLLNAGAAAKIEATAGTQEIACPVAGGALSVNPAAADAGTVTLSGANTFAGPLAVGFGTVRLASLAALGSTSQISIGNATLEYAGEAETLDRTVTFEPGDSNAAALAVAEDSALTFTGDVAQPNGFAVKTGKGVLTVGTAADQTYGNLSVQAGEAVVKGRVTTTGTASVGTMTAVAAPGTDDARLTVDGGTLSVRKSLTVGTADGGKTDELHVKSGAVAIDGNLEFGYQSSGPAQTAKLTVDGGTVTIGDTFRVGVKAGNNVASRAEFTLNGGTVSCAGPTFIGSSEFAPKAVITLNGGVYETTTFRFSWVPGVAGEKHVCFFNEGATIHAPQVSSSSTTTPSTEFAWNGGVWRVGLPSPQFADMNVKVGAKGMKVDMSEAFTKASTPFHGTFAPADGVTTDGGLTVFSSRPATNASLPYLSFPLGKTYGFNGPITLQSGGVLQAYPETIAGKTVVVERNGALVPSASGSASTEVAVKSLKLEDGASLLVLNGVVRVTDALEVGGTAYVGLTSGADLSVATTAGTYPVIRAPKGTLDASKFAISPRYASAKGSFALDTSDDAYDQVTFTLTSATAKGKDFHDEHVWTNASGSGKWTDAANWSDGQAPADLTTDQIVIPADTPDGAVIGLGGNRTAQTVRSDASGEVTLTGGSIKIVGTSESAYVRNDRGTLNLPDVTADQWYELFMDTSAGATQVVRGAYVSTYKTTQVNCRTRPAGTVVIANEASVANGFSVKSGTLAVTPETCGTANTYVSDATIEFLTGGFCATPRISGTDDLGMNLRTDADVYFTGDVSATGPFVKTGKGTAYLGGAGAVNLGTKNRTPSDNLTVAWQIPANGDLPADGLGVFSLAGGKVVTGLDPSQKITVGGRLDIGQNIADFDENGQVLDSELEMMGGTIAVSGDLNIGRTAGSYRQARDCGAKKRNLTLTVRGGALTFNGIYMAHDSTGYYNGTATLNVYGGTVTSKGNYTSFGYYRTSKTTEYGNSKTVVGIYGGMFTNTVTEMKLTLVQGGDFELNMHGGDFGWTAPFKFDGGNKDQKVVLNMCGGTFTAPYFLRNYTGADVRWFWNGGTLQPTEDGQSFNSNDKAWTANVVSEGGAIFRIPGANVYTLNQAFAHDADLGDAEDGGIVKRGTGTLVLSSANGCTGPCVVDEGEMRIATAGAVNGGVVVNADGYLNLGGNDVTATYLKGDGGLVSNGTLTVTGTVDPAATVTVDRLDFGDGAVLRYADGVAFKAVSSVSGRLGVDFGRTEATRLDRHFEAKIADLPASGGAPYVYGLNTGWPEQRRLIVGEVRTNAQGGRELWVKLQTGGVLIFVR